MFNQINAKEAADDYKQEEKSEREKWRFKSISDKVETEKTGQTQEVSATSPAHSSAMSETTAELMDSCDLSKLICLGCGSSGLYCSPVSTPLLYSLHRPVPIQTAPPQPQGTKRPHSSVLSHSLPQPNLQLPEMEISEVYSTRRSIHYTTRGQGFPLMPGLHNIDNRLLQPAPKKKTCIRYSTDQLEHLEALFHEDHYPNAEKRKAIAASVGVTPLRIKIWFQNQRAKWKKAQRSITAKTEHRPSSSPQHNQIKPVLPSLAPNKLSTFSAHFTAAPSFPKSLYSNLSASPGQLRGREEDQHQLSSQGGLAEYQPRPMHSPPPIQRVSLPLFTAPYNPANPNPPLLNTLDHTPPLFLDALEAGSFWPPHDTQPLQTDSRSAQLTVDCDLNTSSSLFDFGEDLDLTSNQQNNLMYQLQTSYPSSQPQNQPQAPLPLMSHTLPPYLTPNPPDSNPTSYLTFEPGGSSAGVETYSTGSHTYFQPQSTGHVLLQSAGHHGGTTVCQSYPWGNTYSQPTTYQKPQCPPLYRSGLVAAQDHQLASSTTLSPSLFFTRDGPSHTNSQPSSHTQTPPAAPLPLSSRLCPP